MPNIVSLVMTVYNRENYLSQAIDSILTQTYPHWQLTIWDDGSTDTSPAIAREYAGFDPRIRFIPAPHTRRQHALRAAIAATTREYLAFVDSDDLLAPDALAATVAILDANPQIGMVYSDHWLIDERGQNLGLGARCQIPYSKERLLIDFMTFHFRLMRRDVYDLCGGIDLDFPQSEDYDLCLKISEITEIYHHPQLLYYYRIHPATISQSQNAAQTERAAAAVKNALQRRSLNDRYQLNVSPNGEFKLQKLVPAPKPKKGVIYCAISHVNYLEAALISALTLRKLEPNLPITIVSDCQILQSMIPAQYQIKAKFVELPESARSSPLISRLIKTDLWQITDYAETLFLDADILPLQPLDQIWQYLEQGNLALAVDRRSTIADCDHIAQSEREHTATLCPSSTTQFNGGVILWRTGADTAHLFQAWQQEWKLFKQQDQLALVRAIWQTQTPIVELPKLYNFPFVDLPADRSDLQPPIQLLHCWGELVSSGKFRQLAKQLDPQITAAVSAILANITSVIPTQPHPAQIIFARGKQERQQGNLSVAQACFEEAIRLKQIVPAYNSLDNLFQAQDALATTVKILDSNPQAEDYDLCLKISEVTEIYHLQQPLYYYRTHPDTSSVQQRDLQLTLLALKRRGFLDPRPNLN